jgi:hypothetical protein
MPERVSIVEERARALLGRVFFDDPRLHGDGLRDEGGEHVGVGAHDRVHLGAEVVEDRKRILAKLLDRVVAGWNGGLPVAAGVVADDAEPLLERRCDAEPHVRAEPKALDQKERLTRAAVLPVETRPRAVRVSHS